MRQVYFCYSLVSSHFLSLVQVQPEIQLVSDQLNVQAVLEAKSGSSESDQSQIHPVLPGIVEDQPVEPALKNDPLDVHAVLEA